jgi:DNA-directed RNA polymerase sigma subunit (sigma70/sigma32)
MQKRKPFNTYGIRTIKEVADMEGVSCARIHQIEQRAFGKIRKVCERHGLELNDLIPITREAVMYG